MNRTDLLLGCGVFCTPLSSEKKYTGCPGNANLRAAHFSPALTDGIIATTPVGQGIWSEISLAHSATQLSHCYYHSVTHGLKTASHSWCNFVMKKENSVEALNYFSPNFSFDFERMRPLSFPCSAPSHVQKAADETSSGPAWVHEVSGRPLQLRVSVRARYQNSQHRPSNIGKRHAVLQAAAWPAHTAPNAASAS